MIAEVGLKKNDFFIVCFFLYQQILGGDRLLLSLCWFVCFLKLSFSQHECVDGQRSVSGSLSGLMGKNNACVSVWEARIQSKQRPSATTHLLIKNLGSSSALYSLLTLTHFFTLHVLRSLPMGKKNHRTSS